MELNELKFLWASPANTPTADGRGEEAWFAHLMSAAIWTAAIGTAIHYRRRMRAVPPIAGGSI